ncbi:MAG TPA: L-histidine N(alpha)-methyltransferase [Candidatus Tectomicrobia bacterium]
MPVTLTFHDSQYPSQVAAQLRQGLRTRRLPGKFLYEAPAQAQRWLAYHQVYSPSRTEPDLLALYQQSCQVALQAVPATSLHYISLGCGGGTKDTLFLQQAVHQRKSVCFTPMDTSAALVVETMLRLQEILPDLPSFPLVVDLEVEPALTAFWEQSEPPATQRLLGCFGMLPNFDYRTFLPYLRRLMRPTDLLLLSANLSPLPYPASNPHIVPQYDNPLARAWFNGLLESLGFSASDVELCIAAQALQPDGHIWQICTDVRFPRQVRLTLYDESFVFHAGDRLRLFFSNRFTPQVMPQVLTEAGLTMVKPFLLASREEGIYLCTASAEIPCASDK